MSVTCNFCSAPADIVDGDDYGPGDYAACYGCHDSGMTDTPVHVSATDYGHPYADNDPKHPGYSESVFDRYDDARA